MGSSAPLVCMAKESQFLLSHFGHVYILMPAFFTPAWMEVSMRCSCFVLYTTTNPCRICLMSLVANSSGFISTSAYAGISPRATWPRNSSFCCRLKAVVVVVVKGKCCCNSQYTVLRDIKLICVKQQYIKIKTPSPPNNPILTQTFDQRHVITWAFVKTGLPVHAVFERNRDLSDCFHCRHFCSFFCRKFL